VTHWLSFDSRNEDEVRAMLDGIVIRGREQPQAEGPTCGPCTGGCSRSRPGGAPADRLLQPPSMTRWVAAIIARLPGLPRRAVMWAENPY
jgi:hypothetical protein